MTLAIYARYSSDRQSEASIEDQVHACESYARAHGLTLPARVYADHAQSGASMAKRPQLLALIAAMRTREISVLLAESVDRLSRDQADVHLIRRAATTNNVRLLTIADGDVTAMVAGLKGIIAEHYLADLAQKTHRGLSGVVRDKRSAGGRCYGYRVMPGERRGVREIDADEAAIVREIFARYIEGQSPLTIARDLNARAIPGPSGALWAVSSINGDARAGDGILVQALYRGQLVWNRRRFVKDPETGRRRGVLNPREQWHIQDVPELRIVAEDVWQAAQARRARLASEPMPVRRRRPRALLSGLVTCEACGGPMIGVAADKIGCANARTRGTCNVRALAPTKLIEARLLEGLKRNMLAPDLVAEAVAAYHDEMRVIAREATRRRITLDRDIAEAKRRARRVIDLMIDGRDTPELRALLNEHEAKIAAAGAELAAMAAPATVELHPAAAELYRAKIARLEEELHGADADAGAIDTVRDMIIAVRLAPDATAPNGWRVTIFGHLAALMRDPAEMRIAPGVSAGGLLNDPLFKVGAGVRTGLEHAFGFAA